MVQTLSTESIKLLTILSGSDIYRQTNKKCLVSNLNSNLEDSKNLCKDDAEEKKIVTINFSNDNLRIRNNLFLFNRTNT